MHRIHRNGQIEYYQEKKADEDFWEKHWASTDIENNLNSENQFILDSLCIYNSKGNRILEAGCGSCSFLYSMHYYGYQAIGVDFAKRTLQTVKRIAPELELCIGNLGKLPFRDATFDGYWSIGVIEHFKDGYGHILNECYRILRVGGVAYISFPYMNLLRKIKGMCRLYNTRRNIKENLEFYQYALDHKLVRKTFEGYGFEFLNKRYMFSYKLLNFCENNVAKLFLNPWHHHSIMLIFRKK